MLTTEDLIAAYDRLVPHQPSRDDRLQRIYRRHRCLLEREVRHCHGLDDWADLRLPCYREARRDLVHFGRRLAAIHARYRAEFAAEDAENAAKNADLRRRMVGLFQEAEDSGGLARLALTRADLVREHLRDGLHGYG
jgi:hypothetical protein